MGRATILMTGLAALALAACGKKEAKDAALAADEAASAQTDAQNAAPSSVDKLADDNLAASNKFLAENAARSGVTTTASGLQYEILAEGPASGKSPAATDNVAVHYVGTLIDGKEFDSSRTRGAAARFPLNGVIPGWTEGVQLMSEGDRFRFAIPAALAYGENNVPGIGPNQALIFDVELLQVNDAARNLAAANAFLAQNGKKPGVKTTASGLQYEALVEGPADGASPKDVNRVTVHYKGTLIDGAEFDSSYARGEPVSFAVGQVIPGWIEGLQLMSAGDKFRFAIPPALAYGETGTPGGPIWPNEALVFEVELISVE